MLDSKQAKPQRGQGLKRSEEDRPFRVGRQPTEEEVKGRSHSTIRKQKCRARLGFKKKGDREGNFKIGFGHDRIDLIWVDRDNTRDLVRGGRLL